MAQPGTNRGSGLSRSEAAILAWKKRARAAKPGALDPKIAARVKEILAAKQKKGKGKAKGGGGKAKGKGTPQEQANQNRAAVAKQGGMGDLEGALVRVGAGMAKGGKDLEPEAHNKLINKGLATRHADGSVTLTGAGKKWKAAADKGDAEGAGAALTEGRATHADAERKIEQAGDKATERVNAKQAKQAEAGKKKEAKQAEAGKKKQAAAAKQKQAAAQRAKTQQAAAKVKADKAKAKAATSVAPKEKGVSRETPKAAAAKEQATNRAKVAQDMADSDTGLSPAGSAALGDFADGKPLKPEAAAEFEKMGIVEKDEQGNHRLTSEGRAAANAMNKGDTRAAVDAISRAGSKKAKADTPPAKKAIDMLTNPTFETNAPDWTVTHDPAPYTLEDLLAIKAGARHSRTDTQHLQSIHDSSVACGASCGPESDDSPETEVSIGDEAEKAVKAMYDDPIAYAMHECQDITQACGALANIAMLLQSELAEANEDEDTVPGLVQSARHLLEYIDNELDKVEDGAPNHNATVGDKPMKGIEVGTQADGEEIAVVSGYNIKAVGADGWVSGYLVKFGGDGDLSQWRDVFTKDTNFGKHTKSDVWIHHRMLPGLGRQQLTNQAELGMDDEGVFVKHLLDLRKSYEAKLYAMVQDGKLGWSSGTAPHLVDRKALGDGRHEITQWTLGLDASYTPMPAGGFVVNAGAMKSLFDDAGVDLLNAIYIDDGSQEAVKTDSTPDGAKVDEARARRLTLELELLMMESV